ncbi:Ig-like domain-containing protein [Enterococcus sp. AZ192]|uniref:Ig-like domain-containing protein n=1 Tax=unclassified Enterococcus TaxID=2608891 RepID=UPI003D2DB9E8
MHAKKLVLPLISCLIFSIFFTKTAYANVDFDNLYVSNPTIIVGNKIVDEQTEISYHQNVSLTFPYAVPNEVTITSGDTMRLDVPANCLIASSFSYDITAADGTVILTITGDDLTNTVTATFGPYYESHTANRQGEIIFYARGSSTVENSDWVMNMVGWNNYDNTAAVWNIIINPDSKYITNTVLTDILGPDQQFDEGFFVQAALGTYDKTTQIFQEQEAIDPAKISTAADSFIIDLGTLNQAVSLTFLSNKLADPNLPYRNKAILEADGEGEPVIIEAETPAIGGGGSGTGEPGESSQTSDTSTEETSETTTEETTTDLTSESTSSEVESSISSNVESTTNETIETSQTSNSSKNQPETTSTTYNVSKKPDSLPKTGEQRTLFFLISGSFLLAGSTIFFVSRNKKAKHNG